MDLKLVAMCLVGLMFVFHLAVDWLGSRSASRPIPDNVRDVYDGEAYDKWLRYFREKTRLTLVGHVVSYAFTLLLLGFDVYARIANALAPEGVYGAALAVLGADAVLCLIYEIPFRWLDAMVVEQKYGFNKMTAGTFAVDQIKALLLNLAFAGGLCYLFIRYHQALGIWLLPVFTALMLALLLVAVFLSPVFGKLYNKFEPLPDGTLRDRLTALLADNGCTVRAIRVMDGSKRSSRANAYFTGLGRTKTIVLYDTLLEQMTEDEIVAVFAHEMGHNKHRDTLKMYFMNIVNIAVMVLVAWGLVSVPDIYGDFGFDRLNYGFAFFLMASVCLPCLSPLFKLLSSALSRRFEYAADRFAAENGYGEALGSALKVLARNSFVCLTPHPALVALTYSHPTVSQRLSALEEAVHSPQ